MTKNIDGFSDLVEDTERYSIPRKDLAFFKEKYGIDTVVLFKSELKPKDRQEYMNDIGEVLFENSEYMVCSI